MFRGSACKTKTLKRSSSSITNDNQTFPDFSMHSSSTKLSCHFLALFRILFPCDTFHVYSFLQTHQCSYLMLASSTSLNECPRLNAPNSILAICINSLIRHRQSHVSSTYRLTGGWAVRWQHIDNHDLAFLSLIGPIPTGRRWRRWRWR